MDEATLALSGLERDRVLTFIEMVTAHRFSVRFGIVPDYDVDNVSRKIARIVLSYIDFVNRVVWHKRVWA